MTIDELVDWVGGSPAFREGMRTRLRALEAMAELRGAERMRERCAREAESGWRNDGGAASRALIQAAAAIRALPLEETL